MSQGLLDLIVDVLAVAPPAKRMLVCHANDSMQASALHGFYSHVWYRTAGPEKATAWPDKLAVDEVILPLPRGKDSLRFCLHALCSVLKPAGSLWLSGVNELGIKSADKPLSELFETVAVAATGGHGRVWKATNPIARVAKDLAALKHTESINLFGNHIHLHSYPGVFAGGKLDEGTALLLDAITDVPATVLDYACGTGILALAASLRNPQAKITVADNDPLALLSAAHNVPGAAQLLTALPPDLTGKYALIVSNPPIHSGDQQSFQVIDLLVRELPRLLMPEGKALIVAQVTVPVARLASMHGLRCQEVAASRSFRVSEVRL